MVFVDGHEIASELGVEWSAIDLTVVGELGSTEVRGKGFLVRLPQQQHRRRVSELSFQILNRQRMMDHLEDR